MDSETGDGHGGADIKRLRSDLVNYSYGAFTTPENLVQNAMAAVHLCEAETRLRSLPNELRDANYLYMNSSGWHEILDKLKQAIMGNETPEILKINLGNGNEWWSTRLHLVSAICADFTSVRQFVFEGKEDRFLGMCATPDVRLALAHLYPAVELAYRRSLPAPGPLFDPLQEVSVIVENYCKQMEQLGGETIVKEGVMPHALQNWRGVHMNWVETSDQTISPKLLKDIVRTAMPFVALVKGGKIIQVINRTTLAANIAVAMLDQMVAT